MTTKGDFSFFSRFIDRTNSYVTDDDGNDVDDDEMPTVSFVDFDNWVNFRSAMIDSVAGWSVFSISLFETPEILTEDEEKVKF